MQLGSLGKKVEVLICDGEQQYPSTVLEAYVYDPDVPENDLEVFIKAHSGKQRLSMWQLGWLVLDSCEAVDTDVTVID